MLSPRALLGRHVRGRAGDVQRLAAPVGVQRHDQPEVEQHHASALVDAHVRRLEIAMQLAHAMERQHAAGKADHRLPQPGQPRGVERLARAARGGRVAAAAALDGALVGAGARGVGERERRRLRRRRRRRLRLRRRHRVDVPRAHVAEEVEPAHQLHRDEPAIAIVQQLVERHQVRVVHVGQLAELLLEQIQVRRLGALSVLSATTVSSSRSRTS